ncbi:TiaS agmantine-binding domain-containing protein [Sulfurisphaera tokodaii]|uniref:TiaS agmantine-binding domain-containing protein n=1 Tax=Sulfurisphaera tokodaii TaxID=111955 RepID=UPI003B837736
MDDHDSPVAGCTTHFSTLLIKELIKEKIKLLDFPYLVRLNPNIPWKTRGNASIKIIIYSERDIDELADIIWNKSIEYTEKISKSAKYNRKPGLAISNKDISDRWFYEKAVKDVIPLNLAIEYAKKQGMIIKGDRGIIGSIAAISYKPKEFTYELITYRPENEWNKNKREIDINSVIEFENKYFPYVFENIDYIKKYLLISPHGTDPILYGIRGIDANILLKGLNEIITNDKIDMAMIFKTNQATDDHINSFSNYFYQTTEIEGEISKIDNIRGGDVIINVNSSTIIVYKETGELNIASKLLKVGDTIRVVGAVKPSVKYGKIIEAEKIEVIKLNNKIFKNPECPKCNGSTESLGKGKGFRCKKCGYRFIGEKKLKEIPRELTLGIYQSRYYRHLSKPIYLNLIKENNLNIDIINNIIKYLVNFKNMYTYS